MTAQFPIFKKLIFVALVCMSFGMAQAQMTPNLPFSGSVLDGQRQAVTDAKVSAEAGGVRRMKL